MNNRQYKQTEMEINIKEVIWGLLEQWKAILIFALVMAMIFAGARYYKSLSGYKAAKEQEAASKELYENLDEYIEGILSKLPENERQNVELLIQGEESLESLTEYLNNSLLMRMDPNAQRQVTMSYFLYDIDGDAYDALCEAYIDQLKGSDFSDAVRKQIQTETEEKYVKELIRGKYNQNYTKDSSGDILKIIVSLPEDANSDELEKDISELMIKHSKDLSSKVAPHKIKLISTIDAVDANEQAFYKRTDTLNSIYGLRNNIPNIKKEMSDEQNNAYNEIVRVMDAAGKEDDISEANENEGIKKPKISKKYALLGFMFGVMIYAFLYIMRLILRERITCAEDVEYHTCARMLGEIYTLRKEKGIKKLFRSSFVDRFRNHLSANNNREIEKIVSTIDAICSHANIDKLTMYLSAKTADDEIKAIVKQAKKKGVDIELAEVDEDLDDASIQNATNAILAADNNLKISTISKLMALFDDYNVKMKGTIYLGETSG